MTGAEVLLSVEIGLIYGIAALGIFLTFRILDFPDLTVDGSFVAGAALSAVALKSGVDPYVALGLGAVAGAAAGLITGVLHVYGRITSLLSGIITSFAFYSINLRIMNHVPNISFFQEETIFSTSDPLIPLCIIAFIGVVLLVYILQTNWGLALRVLGKNQKLAGSYGINVSIYVIITLILSNAFVGFSGGLFSQHQGFSDISQGIGTIVVGLSAILIGEKILPFKSIGWACVACIIGSILYRLCIALALHSDSLGLETSDLNLITSIIIVAIMIFPQIGKHYVRA